MAMVVNETKLNAAMTATADAIREKLGSEEQIPFDYNGGTGFADAVEAIPQGGGGETIESVLGKLINRTLQYFKTGKVTGNQPYIYAALGGSGATYENIVLFSQPTEGAQLQTQLFFNAIQMKYCNVGKCYAIVGQQNFINTMNLKSLVFQKYTGYNTTLANANAFSGSSIASGTGYVYFPDKDENGNNYPDIIKGLSNWATFASQIRGYSEAPAYDSATTYEIGDVCKYNGKFYGYCKEDLTSSTGNAPSGTTDDNAYWEYVGELG